MARIFISYAEEDSPEAVALARAFEEGGFSAWYYERDTVPGVPYPAQIEKAIAAASAMVLVASPDMLRSPTIESEVLRAHETGKAIIPLLKGISFSEVRAANSTYSFLLAKVAARPWPEEGVPALWPELDTSLAALGVAPDLESESSWSRETATTLRHAVGQKEHRSSAAPRRNYWKPAAAGAGLLAVVAMVWAFGRGRAERPAPLVRAPEPPVPAAVRAPAAAAAATAPKSPPTYDVDVKVRPQAAMIQLDGRWLSRGHLRTALPADGRIHTLRFTLKDYFAQAIDFNDLTPVPSLVTLKRREERPAPMMKVPAWEPGVEHSRH